MKNKILWLSILGLALARPPNPIDSTTTNLDQQQQQQKQRNSRSIWPFSSSEPTTEEPPNYPPALPDNNEWFVRGETPLPQGIDLKKYPVWKVHKYNGIDLHPVKLQPENKYPPEIHHVVEPQYSSGSSSSSDFYQNGYPNEYQDFRTHSTGYPTPYSSPSSAYPSERETYQSGGFHSSSFTPGSHQYNIQSQQKYEVYAHPEHLTDFRPTVAPEHHQVPLNGYGLSNTHHDGEMGYQGHNQEEQTQSFGVGEEQLDSNDGSKPDLSFLDDLGGLAPFLPEPVINKENTQLEESEAAEEEEGETPEEGFFEKLFSRFRGSTEAPAPEVALVENTTPANSGGFLSSVFGFNSQPQSPEITTAVTESSGNPFSSLFYRTESEKPVVVEPTTYYLPKTRGSYIAVKLPSNVASSFAPNVGPYNDVSNLAFHEVPEVPFRQHEIPHIASPTLDSGYPYKLGYSEIRNSGSYASAVSSDYQPSPVFDQPRLPTSKIAPHFTQTHGTHHQEPDFRVENFSSNQGESLDAPRAEYFHSVHNEQENGVPILSSQPPLTSNYYQGQQNLQDSRASGMHQIPSTANIPLAEDQASGIGYVNAMTSSSADELDHNQSENGNRSPSGQHQFQTLDTTSSRLQGVSNTQETFGQSIEPVSMGQDVNQNEPISAPQISGGFVPSVGYSSPVGANDQLNFVNNNQENGQETPSTSGNIAYDHSLDNIGDTLTQNFDTSSVLSPDLLPPKKIEPDESPVSFYQTQISALQNTAEPTEQDFLPVNDAYDFRETSSDQDEGDSHFINNLNGLTSYGIPSNSYNTISFGTASSNLRNNIAVPAPAKDEVNGGVNINTNKDVYRFTLPEQLPTKKVDRVVRKVMKRRNLVESNLWRRSTPERQAPTEETDTSLIIRSENDSIPEVRGSRQFDEAKVIDGYSKVQQQQHHHHHHQQHREFVQDTAATTKLTPVLETVQH